MEITISEVIRNKRRSMNISQVDLAEALGITVQAVSKWETGGSYPDITLLPKIAEIFELSLDKLFFGEKEAKEAVLEELPDDGKLRVVQCLGKRVLKKDEYINNKPFELVIPKNEAVLNFEIWGGAQIEGDISGSASSGGGMNCGSVGGGVSAGSGVNCGPVGGGVDAGSGVNCGPVGGNVDAGGCIRCGDIGGHADAGGNIECDDIGGDAGAGDSIECNDIGGDAGAGDSIECNEIKGNASADNLIKCAGNIGGDAICNGKIVKQ
ncbi:MAG: helix-turn-helix domain-containing protein [Bacteroides sp.]|nr:helix-turn-helix domain-containing protein [Bacteroides sp.]